MTKIIVAYIPVLHEGYRRLLECHKDADVLYVWGPEVIGEVYYLSKEIRQLDPALVAEAIRGWKLFKEVKVLSLSDISTLQSVDTLVMPEDDISHEFAEKHLPGKEVTFENIFLRWDKHNALKEKPVVPEESITREVYHQKMIATLTEEAKKSSDMWRHVAAAIVKDGKVLFVGHNDHVPSPHMPYAHGDPRSCFHKGVNIDISTAFHAEASLIASAAREGMALEGADMYVTVFPCPPCAKLIAYSGVKTLYCGGGYAVLDGDDILKSRGVKVVFVE